MFSGLGERERERESERAHLIVITACLFSHALTRPHYRKVDLFGSLLFGRGSTTERQRMCVCACVFVCVFVCVRERD